MKYYTAFNTYNSILKTNIINNNNKMLLYNSLNTNRYNLL